MVLVDEVAMLPTKVVVAVVDMVPGGVEMRTRGAATMAVMGLAVGAA